MLSLRLLMGTGGRIMGAEVKSIQHGVFPAVDVTDTITEVDMSKSICMLLGFSSTNGQSRYVFGSVVLTASTEVSGYGAVGGNIAYQVIEFLNGIKSSQRGVIEIPDGDLTADYTISEVDISKCMLSHNGNRWGAIEKEECVVATIEFLNSTTLRVTKGVAELATYIYFDLLEFE